MANVPFREQVASAQHTSTAATALPLELQQQIYSYLDAKSFYTARKVSRWWRFASLDAVTLSHQLKRLPILPQVDAGASSPAELQKLFADAARTLMLGVHVDRLHDTPGCFATATTRSLTNYPRWTANRRGDRTATLNDRTIQLFDTSAPQPVLLADRPLNDLKETVGNGPWLKITPSASNVLALSSDGGLLAVAQERTIQIYDLTAEPDSFTVNHYLASAAGHSICGLDFEQDDHVLRVGLSGRGMVLYVGTPPKDTAEGVKATIAHWKSKAGLKHTFLDSARLTFPTSPLDDDGRDVDQVAHISGLQLLRPYQQGFLFAGQTRRGGENSYYMLGHVKTSPLHDTGASTVETTNVTLLARLESFLSCWDYTINEHSDAAFGLWENMPSAHEHYPRFVLSDDGSLLGLAERDKKRIRPQSLTQLFVYRLPSEKQILHNLHPSMDRTMDGSANEDCIVDQTKQSQFPTSDPNALRKSSEFRVPRIPLCLSTVQGDVMNLTFEQAAGNANANALVVTTVETTRNWVLTDI